MSSDSSISSDPVADHRPVDDHLVAGVKPQDVALDDLGRVAGALHAAAHQRHRRPGEQRDVVQLPLGVDFLAVLMTALTRPRPTLVMAS